MSARPRPPAAPERGAEERAARRGGGARGGRGVLRRVLGAGLLLLATFARPSDMAAQTPPAAPAPPRDTGEGDASEAEREALSLSRDDKHLTARTRAEAILERDPDSIIGHFVMATALRDAEGSLPRAMAHYRRARELYEARYGTSEGEGRPWRVYAETLFGIAITAGLMEDFEGELRAMDDYDARFSPKLLAQRVWPLMKLGRYDEARQWAKAAIDSGSSFQKLRAMNGLCAVEAEEMHRVGNYEACLAAYRYAKDLAAHASDPSRRPEVTVYANNAHLAALAMLKYDEAEQFALDGTKDAQGTSSNPWLRLARMYIDQGRAAEAVTATKSLQAWRVMQPPSTREQFSAEDESTVALLLFTAGEAGAALRLADRVLGRPDRRAMTSTSPEHTAGANALLRRAILRLSSELASERASCASWGRAPRHRAEAARLLAAAWPDEQRVAGALLDERTLTATLRLYMDNGLDYVPTWLIGDLVDVLGAGVFVAALDEARREETEVPGYAAFYDGLEAEARLAQGDEAAALDLARKALDALPKAEVLFKARVAAVGAAAAQRAGDAQAALGLFERAMLADPGVVRRLGLRLPVRFQTGGGDLANETLDLLRASPRLEEAPEGFVVSVQAGSGGSGEIQVCMHTPLGAELGCARVPVTPPPPPVQPAGEGEKASGSGAGAGSGEGAPPPAPREPWERAAEAFHKTVFALKMNLSESDLRSLDGGTTATRDAARERMRDLLGDDPSPADGN